MRARIAIVTDRTPHHACCECDEDTLDTPWKAKLCTVLHSRDEAEVRRRLDVFLEEQMPEVRRILGRVKRITRLQWDDDDLALSCFGQALMKMVERRWRSRSGAGTSQVFNYSRNLPMILEAETRSCIRDDRRRGLLDGTADIPGGETQDRKATVVKKSRQLFVIEHDRQPSDDELVTFHNERVRATRKDASRQSVLIARDDLRVEHAVSLDQARPAIDAQLAVRGAGNAGALDWSDRIAALFSRCEQLDLDREHARTRRLVREPVRSADVAKVYFAHHAEGDFPTRGEIAEQLGITGTAARRELGTQLRTVLGLAREMFADYRHAD